MPTKTIKVDYNQFGSKRLNEVADYILSLVEYESGDSITNLKLQKLLYFCQGWNLSINGKELFEDDFKAWLHGPVVPEIYHRFKDYQYNSISPVDSSVNLEHTSLTDNEKDLIEEVYESYGSLTAKQLEHLTHQHDPWVDALQKATETNNSPIIPKDSIKAYFTEKVRSVESA